MTIQEAFKKGIRRIYLKRWVTGAYLELPLLPGGMHGPWISLIDPVSQKMLGDVSIPQKILSLSYDTDKEDEYFEYKGSIREGDSEWNESYGIEKVPV